MPDANGHTSQDPGDSCQAGWRELHPQLDHYQTLGPDPPARRRGHRRLARCLGASITTPESVFMGFGFEGISSQAERDLVMGRAMGRLRLRAPGPPPAGGPGGGFAPPLWSLGSVLLCMSGADDLARGQALYAQGAWGAAHQALVAVEAAAPLAADDLERLATTAYMLGRLEEYVEAMGRSHQAHLDASAPLPAARCAFWLGMQLLLAGEMGRGTGWIGRAQRLVDEVGEDCVERGHLRLPAAFRCQSVGAYGEGAKKAAEAVAIARRFGDRDLFAVSVHVQGVMLVRAGRALEGMALLDEAMVAITAGQVSPIVTGMVYCGVILGCQHAYEPGRAREWTEALTEWCERQPDMIAFSGRCHVHRAEVMQLGGAWAEALAEARYAAGRAERGNHRSALAAAAYVQGEVHRLRGEVAEAEEAYRRASECGRDPQPGLSLLRLAQGDVHAARAAIRTLLAQTTDRIDRLRQLPACVEILLAAGEHDAAARLADELDAAARSHDSMMLRTIALQTRGAVDLAAGNAEGALPALRRAWQAWEELLAPYEAARVRALIAAACRDLGDHDGGALQLEAARVAFEQLGARTDLRQLHAAARQDASGGLTPRELEVLRLVAEGHTNRAIAEAFVISERTVDRHVGNIFAKFGVSSRAAATAHAYEQRLL